jgi:cell division protein FtsZ
LLNNTDIHGAQKILLSIMSGDQAELEMDELTEITEYIQDKAGQDAEVIFGHGIDSTLGQSIRVTVIATGFARDAHTINTGFVNNKVADSEPDPQINLFDKDRQEAPAPIPVAVPTFSQPAPAPAPTPVEPPKVTFDLETSVSNYVPPVAAPSSPAPELVAVQQPAPQPQSQPSAARQSLDTRADERRRRLQDLSNGLTNDAIKDQLETPAYLRRHVKLENVTPSNERDISRFNLSDDNELLGDNRFLHDNVD